MKKPVPDTPREIRQRIVETRMVSAAVLKRNPANFRTHPADQRRDVARLFEEVGQVAAFMAVEQSGGDLLLLDGHLRSDIADDRAVRVDVVDLSEDESRLVLAMFDHTGAMAGVNVAKLQALMASVRADRPSWEMQLTSAAAAMQLQARSTAARKRPVVQDVTPEPPAIPITKPGDLWALGDHRLLCGDATKAEDVRRLMAGALAAVVFTDPPYGVNIAGSLNSQTIAGDITQTAIPFAFDLAVTVATTPDARLYFCGAETNIGLYGKLFERACRQLPRHLIWVKNGFVMKPNGYHNQYEIIYHGYKSGGGALARWYAGRTESEASDVWRVDRDQSNTYKHPTQKPVELPARAIRNSSQEGDIVYEPFAGSGSTLIAAAQLSRRCFALEIDPVWCDVVVARWENHTGKKAVRNPPGGK